MAGSNYTKIPKELDHHKNGLINIQSVDDNECFKSCLVRCLHPADHYPARIRKADKDFARKLDFKDIKFPVKFRDIHKIKKKKKILSPLVFLVMKTKKIIESIFQENAARKNILTYY